MASLVLKDPATGEIVRIPDDDNASATVAERGLVVASPEEIATADQKRLYGGEKLQAAGETALRAATFGAFQGAGSEETIRERSEAFRRDAPISAFAAQTAGAALPAIATGGVVGAASGALGAGAGVARGAAIAAEGLTGGLADEIEQARAEDREVSAGNVLANAVLGEVMGRGMVYSAGAVKRGATTLIGKVKHRNAALAAERKALDAGADTVSGAPAGPDRDVFLANAGKEVVDRASTRMATSLDEIAKGMDKLTSIPAKKGKLRAMVPKTAEVHRDWANQASREAFELRQRLSAAARKAPEAEVPVSLEGRTLEDLGALTDPQSFRKSTLEGLRGSDEFKRTGRVPESFDRRANAEGITVRMDDGKPYLADGRHRFLVAQESGAPSVYGRVKDASGKEIFRGDIPLRGEGATAAPGRAEVQAAFKRAGYGAIDDFEPSDFATVARVIGPLDEKGARALVGSNVLNTSGKPGISIVRDRVSVSSQLEGGGRISREFYVDGAGRKTAEHQNFYLEGKRGQGLGKKVLDDAIETYRQHGIERVVLDARGGSDEIWKRYGFEPVGTGTKMEMLLEPAQPPRAAAPSTGAVDDLTDFSKVPGLGGITGKIRHVLERVTNDLDGAVESHVMRDVTEDAVRDLGRIEKQLGVMSKQPGLADSVAIGDLKQAVYDFRHARRLDLERPELWGKAADYQRGINSALHDNFIEGITGTQKDMARRMGTDFDTGSPLYQYDPAKVRRILSADEVGQGLTPQMLDKQLTGVEQAIATHRKFGTATDAELKRMEAAVASVREQMQLARDVRSAKKNYADAEGLRKEQAKRDRQGGATGGEPKGIMGTVVDEAVEFAVERGLDTAVPGAGIISRFLRKGLKGKGKSAIDRARTRASQSGMVDLGGSAASAYPKKASDEAIRLAKTMTGQEPSGKIWSKASHANDRSLADAMVSKSIAAEGFEKTVKSVPEALNESQRGALVHYVGQQFAELQKNISSKTSKEAIAGLDAAIDAGLNVPGEITRGLWMTPEELSKLAGSKVFQTPGFMSGSVNRNYARRFAAGKSASDTAGKQPVILHVHQRTGVPMWKDVDQGEIVLRPGTKFEVRVTNDEIRKGVKEKAIHLFEVDPAASRSGERGMVDLGGARSVQRPALKQPSELGSVSGAPTLGGIATSPIGITTGVGAAALAAPVAYAQLPDETRGAMADAFKQIRRIVRGRQLVKNLEASGKQAVESAARGAVRGSGVRAKRSVDSPVVRGTETISASAARTALSRFTGDYPTPAAAFEARRKTLEAAQNDPMILYDAVGNGLGELPRSHPKLHGAIAARAANAQRYLYNNLPAQLAATALRPHGIPMSRATLRDFAQKWNSVTEPMTVLEDVRDGLATPTQLRALAAVHPDLHQSLKMAMLREVAQNPGIMTTQRKLRLDILFGTDGAAGRSYAWPMAKAIKSLNQGQQKQGPPSGGGGMPSAPMARASSNIASSVTNG